MPTAKPPLTIVKIGGNIIDNPENLRSFLNDFSTIPCHKILIHGGGKIATQMATKLGIVTQIIDGRRVTDQPMLDVVTMVYGGLVNKQIVAQLQAMNCNALGLTGADAGIIQSVRRTGWNTDYGFVGDVKAVNAPTITSFLQQNLVPIIAPLTFDSEGNILNTNADTMASAVAVALAKTFETALVYCFEKRGVLSNIEDDNSAIENITPVMYHELKKQQVIYQGMIPKLDNAFDAIAKGVDSVCICHANDLLKPQKGTKLSKN